MAGGAGCQLLGLRATRLIERDLLLALKASLEVVGGLAVASQIDLSRQAAILYRLARAGLVDGQWEGYLFELLLSQLMDASFPEPGNAERVRRLIEADVGADALGIGVHRSGGKVRFAYPITVAAGTKPA